MSGDGIPIDALNLTAPPHVQAVPDECEHFEEEPVAVLWGAGAEIRKCLSCGKERRVKIQGGAW